MSGFLDVCIQLTRRTKIRNLFDSAQIPDVKNLNDNRGISKYLN